MSNCGGESFVAPGYRCHLAKPSSWQAERPRHHSLQIQPRTNPRQDDWVLQHCPPVNVAQQHRTFPWVAHRGPEALRNSENATKAYFMRRVWH